jgi:very-short-patch-repair endonuclease
MTYKGDRNRPEQRDRRRQLRRDQTFAEKSLWSQLRGSNHGVKFTRQYGCGNFIIDFYCPALSLAIEVDGATHDSADAQARDSWRQGIIEEEGIVFLRFKDEEVLHDANHTLEIIDAKIKELSAAKGIELVKSRMY